ncbi:uncharacterized protein J5F26_017296 [Ciconia maguari]
MAEGSPILTSGVPPVLPWATAGAHGEQGANYPNPHKPDTASNLAPAWADTTTKLALPWADAAAKLAQKGKLCYDPALCFGNLPSVCPKQARSPAGWRPAQEPGEVLFGLASATHRRGPLQTHVRHTQARSPASSRLSQTGKVPFGLASATNKPRPVWAGIRHAQARSPFALASGTRRHGIPGPHLCVPDTSPNTDLTRVCWTRAGTGTLPVCAGPCRSAAGPSCRAELQGRAAKLQSQAAELQGRAAGPRPSGRAAGPSGQAAGPSGRAAGPRPSGRAAGPSGRAEAKQPSGQAAGLRPSSRVTGGAAFPARTLPAPALTGNKVHSRPASCCREGAGGRGTSPHGARGRGTEGWGPSPPGAREGEGWGPSPCDGTRRGNPPSPPASAAPGSGQEPPPTHGRRSGEARPAGGRPNLRACLAAHVTARKPRC